MAIKDRPILMSAPMVRALLAGTKTQTRRAVKEHNVRDVGAFTEPVFVATRKVRSKGEHVGNRDVIVRCPYGKPGDRLWVRETWRRWENGGRYVAYRADGRFLEPKFEKGLPVGVYQDGIGDGYLTDGQRGLKGWAPCIYMPRWASRITLEITEVRVQRLQEISEEDAVAEGVERIETKERLGWKSYDPEGICYFATDSYASLWDSINGSGSWNDNPWVWALSFRRIS